MLHRKNTNFQDLSKYIPEGFREGEFSCLQTRYGKEDSEAMVATIHHLAGELLSTITTTSRNQTFLPLPEDDNLSVWINKYGPGQRTGFHHHNDAGFTKNANHYAIYVIAVGSQPETISFIQNEVQRDIIVTPGDLFVGHCTEIHGALPVKEYLCAMMFKINA